LVLGAIVLVPFLAGIVNLLLSKNSSTGWTSVIGICSFLIVFLGQLAFLSAITKEGSTVASAYKKGLRLFLPSFWILALIVLVSLGGSILFIIPSILLSIWLSLSFYVLVIENRRGISALTGSWHYTRGYWWPMFFRVLFLGILYALISWIFLLGGRIVWVQHDILWQLFRALFGYYIVLPLSAIYIYRIYLGLKEIKLSVPYESDERKSRKVIIIFLILGILVLVLMFALYSINLARLKNARSTQANSFFGLQAQPASNNMVSGSLPSSQAGSIQDLLNKAKSIGPVQYEKQSTTSFNNTPGITLTMKQKIWQKLPYMRIETSSSYGLTSVMIVRPEGAYTSSAGASYSFIPYSSSTAAVLLDTLQGNAQEMVQNNTLKIDGTESINNKITTIVEYTVERNGLTATTKSWIENDTGIPVKTETTTQIAGQTQTVVSESSNFVFGDIPDSMFDVPQDKLTTTNSATEAGTTDTERKSNVQAIATALSLYTKEQVPPSATPAHLTCPASWLVSENDGIGCPDLNYGSPPLSTFLSSLPTDPEVQKYMYINIANNTTFCLGVRLDAGSLYACGASGCTEKPGTWSAYDCTEN